MNDKDEPTQPTVFDDAKAALDAALDAMPAPDPPSSRQVIIACRAKLRARIKTHGWKATHACVVEAGHNIGLGTFKDYVYEGVASRDAKTATEAARKRRSKPKTELQTEPGQAPAIISIPDAASEVTAPAGQPVRAYKQM